jgi:hypothetical protein
VTYYINKQEARSMARADLTIFNEVNAIMKQIITDAGNGLYETTVSDGTTMTESTPTSTVTGTQVNPTITGTPTLIIAGVTITLGTSGTSVNAVVGDINDAGVTGLVASKDAGNNLVLSYTHPQQASWSVAIGSGTANADLGLTAGTTSATNPSSVDYFSVWQGVTNDRAKTDQMNQVISYFENLGYTISRLTNTATNKTFKWVISY